MSETHLQRRNASDSSDHVVKIVDRLVCGVHTGRKNSRRRNIVEILFLGQVGNRLEFKLECNSLSVRILLKSFGTFMKV